MHWLLSCNVINQICAFCYGVEILYSWSYCSCTLCKNEASSSCTCVTSMLHHLPKAQHCMRSIVLCSHQLFLQRSRGCVDVPQLSANVVVLPSYLLLQKHFLFIIAVIIDSPDVLTHHLHVHSHVHTIIVFTQTWINSSGLYFTGWTSAVPVG